jgi:hypothetical protein
MNGKKLNKIRLVPIFLITLCLSACNLDATSSDLYQEDPTGKADDLIPETADLILAVDITWACGEYNEEDIPLDPAIQYDDFEGTFRYQGQIKLGPVANCLEDSWNPPEGAICRWNMPFYCWGPSFRIFSHEGIPTLTVGDYAGDMDASFDSQLPIESVPQLGVWSTDFYPDSASGSWGYLTVAVQRINCCKVCTQGIACGDTCISAEETCNADPGCACQG